MFNQRCIIICKNIKEIKLFVEFCNKNCLRWHNRKSITIKNSHKEELEKANENIVYWLDDSDGLDNYGLSFSDMAYLRDSIKDNGKHPQEIDNINKYVIYSSPMNLIIKNKRYLLSNNIKLKIL